MNNHERLASYVARKTGKNRLAVLSEDNPLLTPAMRRRLRKKRNAHSHAGLPLVSLADGSVRRVPCGRCHPLPRMRLIGG